MNTLQILSRLLLAALLGSLIGVEREKKHRAAGLRTHIIVSVASCLIMLISIDGYKTFYGNNSWDATRFASQVISGIGFLGAGTILQKKDVVKGLTTAATLWLCAANGLAVGIGYYKGAIFATVICLITLISLKGMDGILSKRYTASYHMSFESKDLQCKDFEKICEEEGIELSSINILELKGEEISELECTLSIPNSYKVDVLISKLKNRLNLLDYHQTN